MCTVGFPGIRSSVRTKVGFCEDSKSRPTAVMLELIVMWVEARAAPSCLKSEFSKSMVNAIIGTGCPSTIVLACSSAGAMDCGTLTHRGAGPKIR